MIRSDDMVCCFGELLLRMSPGSNWIGDASIPVYVGGAELNVATALANWEIPVRYCTALPANFIGDHLIEHVDKRGIDTATISRRGDRTGIYYLPQGKDLKNAGVIYDRSHSSFSELKPGMLDWQEILKGCSWFHFSAISPALNENIALVCKEGIRVAKDRGLTVSLDLNYRSKLWQYNEAPVNIMHSLMPYCDVVMGNGWAAESLLGIPFGITDSKLASHEELVDATGNSMLRIHEKYPHVQAMAYTFRMDDSYFAVLQHGSGRHISRNFFIGEKPDPVGSGDCFMAGLIYGLYRQLPGQEVVDFASAAAVGKLQEKGDATRQTVNSIQNRLNIHGQE